MLYVLFHCGRTNNVRFSFFLWCATKNRPYDDAYAITSMVLSIITVFISWVWWVTFITSLVGMVIFQTLWCARMPSGGLYAPVIIAAITSATSLGVAIYVLVEFRTKSYCYAWILDAGSYDNWPETDWCPEKAWFVVALICSLLWGVAACCTFWFIKSGRHAKWEDKHTPGTPAVATDVELAVSSPAQEPVVASVAAVVYEKEDITD